MAALVLFFLRAIEQQKQRLKVKLEREKLLLSQLPYMTKSNNVNV
jgi:hypothetical protein